MFMSSSVNRHSNHHEAAVPDFGFDRLVENLKALRNRVAGIPFPCAPQIVQELFVIQQSAERLSSMCKPNSSSSTEALSFAEVSLIQNTREAIEEIYEAISAYIDIHTFHVTEQITDIHHQHQPHQ